MILDQGRAFESRQLAFDLASATAETNLVHLESQTEQSRLLAEQYREHADKQHEIIRKNEERLALQRDDLALLKKEIEQIF